MNGAICSLFGRNKRHTAIAAIAPLRNARDTLFPAQSRRPQESNDDRQEYRF